MKHLSVWLKIQFNSTKIHSLQNDNQVEKKNSFIGSIISFSWVNLITHDCYVAVCVGC